MSATSTPLASALIASVSPAVRAVLPGASELEALLAEGHRDGEAKWPGVRVPQPKWIACLAERLERYSRDAGTAPPLRLSDVRLADLYLACACQAQTSSAARAYDQHLAPHVDKALLKMRVAPSEAQEIAAELRTEMLVAADADHAPKIAGFLGRGAIQGWIRAAAVHTVMQRRRRQDREVPFGPDDLANYVSEVDPALRYLRERCVREFKNAFADGMKRLSVKQRNLLRQRYLDGLSVDTLAALRGTHRATMSRWLSEARDVLLQAVRGLLAERMHLSPKELDSFLRVVRDAGEFEMSLGSMLATKGKDTTKRRGPA